ncbi:hypothetical protein PTKIN_Ptkin18bG0086900 [Pterospermum kingtungense]
MSPMSSPAVPLFFSLFLLSLYATDALSLSSNSTSSALAEAQTDFNITQFLKTYPDFTLFNNYLSQTGVADQINSQPNRTVLVVANDNMTALAGQSQDAIKKAMGLQVILGYYDPIMLRDASATGRITLTTLYQLSGKAQNKEGFLVAVSEGKNYPVMFASAIPDAALSAMILKPLDTQPKHISVLQVTELINTTSMSAPSSSSPAKAPAPVDFNITEFLQTYPDFTTFNKYLSETGVADQINSQPNRTVLVVANDNMTALAGQSQDAIKKALSLQVILGYYDPIMLRDASPTGRTTLTTLYQLSGKAQNKEGFLVAVSEGKNYPVMFASAIPDAPLSAMILKPLDTQPKHISVLQVTELINTTSMSAPSSSTPAKAPTPVNFNITEFLQTFPDFTTFNKYLSQTGVADQINSQPNRTVLVVANGNMTALAGQSQDAIKKAMSLQVILGYYDPIMLRDASPTGRITLTTLYQLSGKAQNKEGYLVAVSEGKNYPVIFASAIPDAPLSAMILKPLETQPKYISVLHVTELINTTSMSAPPSSAPAKAPAASSPSSSTGAKAPAASPSTNATAPSTGSNSTTPSSPRASPPRKALAPSPPRESPLTSPKSSTPTAPSADTPAGSAADAPGSSKSSAISVTSRHYLASIFMVFTSAWFLLTMI